MKKAWAFVFVALALTSACRKPAVLGGSMGDKYDMQYDQVRAYWVGRELVLIYEMAYQMPAQIGGYGDVVDNQVVRLQFNTARQAVAKDVDIDLVGDPSYPNASIYRYSIKAQGLGGVIQDDAPAALQAGTIRFSSFGTQPGDTLRGTIACTLSDGSNMHGPFDTRLVAP